MGFNFINLVARHINFLIPEFLLHEAFLCYVYVCSDQHVSIQNVGNPADLVRYPTLVLSFKHFNNANWYNQETGVNTITN